MWYAPSLRWKWRSDYKPSLPMEGLQLGGRRTSGGVRCSPKRSAPNAAPRILKGRQPAPYVGRHFYCGRWRSFHGIQMQSVVGAYYFPHYSVQFWRSWIGVPWIKDKEAKKALVCILISTLVLVALLFLLAQQYFGFTALGIVAFIIVWYSSLNSPQAKYFKIELNIPIHKEKMG